jgi:hypothetical protein
LVTDLVTGLFVDTALDTAHFLRTSVLRTGHFLRTMKLAH